MELALAVARPSPRVGVRPSADDRRRLWGILGFLAGLAAGGPPVALAGAAAGLIAAGVTNRRAQ